MRLDTHRPHININAEGKLLIEDPVRQELSDAVTTMDPRGAVDGVRLVIVTSVVTI